MKTSFSGYGLSLSVAYHHQRNEVRLWEIHPGSANVENFADGVASIDLANVEKHIKTGGLLDWGRRNTVPPCYFSATQTCNFSEINLSWK